MVCKQSSRDSWLSGKVSGNAVIVPKAVPIHSDREGALSAAVNASAAEFVCRGLKYQKLFILMINYRFCLGR